MQRPDPSDPAGFDLRHHGDAETGPGLLDLAVNVRRPAPPQWLQARLGATLTQLGSYPEPGPAREAVAARHRRSPQDVLLCAGAAEAFVLIARAFAPQHAVCVHPSFTEPESALRAAGVTVHRVVLPPPFELDPGLIPAQADLVILGNPTNPTSRSHPAQVLAGLARPGRILVVDEAFADAIAGEPESLAARVDLPGLIVVRSLTKTWGLAGLRVGYLLAAPELVNTLAAAQPLWSVSTPALAALEACSEPAAVQAVSTEAAALARVREEFTALLHEIPELTVTPAAAAPFLLVQGPAGLRAGLRASGIAVRRGDTFPGLDDSWVRLAVPARIEHSRVIREIRAVLARDCAPAGRPAVAVAVAVAAVVVAGPGTSGRVTLVGAGPGPVDLLTLRGWRALHEADVVITDRLVSADLLEGLRPGVELVEVGKAPGRHAATQDDINSLLVEHAQRGLSVVRLKGGDPFVFGRGGEELLACAKAGVATTVIPGLSSAIAVPTLAGVPVTHRGLAQSFTVVSGHLPPGHPGSTVDWSALGRSDETVVLLMGVATLASVAASLLASGRAADTPVVSIENGGSARQRVVRSTLETVERVMIDSELRNPAVTVIGPAAAALD